MKKLSILLYSLLLSLSFLFVSCKAPESLTLSTPAGAPGVAHALMQKKIKVEGKEYQINVEIVNDPKTLPSMFQEAKSDLITAPVNVGVKFAATYELAGSLTGGNVFLVSKSDLTTLSGRKVTSFFQKGTSVNSLLLENPKVFGKTFTLDVKNQSELPQLYKDANASDIFVMAEPQLSILKKQFPDLKYEEKNLHTEFTSQYTGKSFIQAATFVNKKLDKKVAETLLNTLKDSASAVNEDAKFDKVFDSAKKLGIIPQNSDKETLKMAFKRSSISYSSENIANRLRDLVSIAKELSSDIFKDSSSSTGYIEYNSFFTVE